jgi:hypothetical protein
MKFKRRSLLILIVTLVIIFISFLYRHFTWGAGEVQTVIFKGTDPCTYWKSIFDFAMIAAGILTAAVVMIGGLYYIVSFGQHEKLQRAKDVMTGAITGLLLTLTSWGLFNLLAPTLLKCEIKVRKLILPQPTTRPTTPTRPTGAGAGPGGISDPCAGVPPEKLFATEEECKTKGGADGGACKGVCMQSTAAAPAGPTPEGQACTTDADCPEGQWCGGVAIDEKTGEPVPLSGSCQTGTKAPTTLDIFNRFVKNKFSLFSEVQATINDPDVSAPAAEEQTQQQQTQQKEAERTGKWCCVGSGTCKDVIARGIGVDKPNDKEGLEAGGVIKRIRCQWCYDGNPPGAPDACENQQNPVSINPNICRFLIALKDAGFNPSVRCIICGHTRCAGAWYEGKGTCKVPQCGENPSDHWDGNGLDLNPDERMQKYIVENLMSTFGITKVIGPAGWDESQIPGGCPCPSSKNECRKGIYSQYNILNGRPHSYPAYTLCGHDNHIHLSF